MINLRLFNPQEDPAGGMVEGFLEACPGLYTRVPVDRGNNYGIRRTNCDHKVSVIVGGGSGNDPWCLGYIGEGMADAGVIGSVYTAPSVRAIQAVTRSVPHKDGVVYICTNHAGDVLGFELAGEVGEMEGISSRTIAVTDDIASALPAEKNQRRGMAGVLFVVKTAGGAASLGMSMEDVARIAGRANENTYSYSAIVSPFRDPITEGVLFDLRDGMVAYGVGMSGEPGLLNKAFVSADVMADTVIRFLLNEIQPLPMNEIAVLINGFGKTSEMEMAIVASRVYKLLRREKINIAHMLNGKVYSPVDCTGFSVSIMCMDEELKRCFEVPAWTPILQGFSEKSMELGVHFF